MNVDVPSKKRRIKDDMLVYLPTSLLLVIARLLGIVETVKKLTLCRSLRHLYSHFGHSPLQEQLIISVEQSRKIVAIPSWFCWLENLHLEGNLYGYRTVPFRNATSILRSCIRLKTLKVSTQFSELDVKCLPVSVTALELDRSGSKSRMSHCFPNLAHLRIHGDAEGAANLGAVSANLTSLSISSILKPIKASSLGRFISLP
jgi:hypothetical protein